MNFACECSKHHSYSLWRNCLECNSAIETNSDFYEYHLKYDGQTYISYYHKYNPNKMFFSLSNYDINLEKDFTYGLGFEILDSLEKELKRMVPSFSKFFVNLNYNNYHYDAYDTKNNLVFEFSGTESEFCKVFFKFLDNLEFI